MHRKLEMRDPGWRFAESRVEHGFGTGLGDPTLTRAGKGMTPTPLPVQVQGVSYMTDRLS